MKCPTCGNGNPEGAQFCGQCGIPLSASLVNDPTPQEMVSFPTAVALGFQRYADFSGRSTRAEYWWWSLFFWAVLVILTIVNVITSIIGMGGAFGLLGGLFGLAILIPSLALGARRLHDIGKSGWWQLGLLLPIAGPVLLFIAIAVAVLTALGGELAFVVLILIAVGLIAVFGLIIWWIVWLVRKGDYGPNKYGLDPRQPTLQ